MNLIVFGATGIVGKQVVQQALFKQYHVKAFGRNVFTTDFLNDKNLQLIKGALFDENEVYNALKNCDNVISCLGGGFDETDKTRSLGIKNIIAQMKKSDVKRIIAIGGSGVLNAEEENKLIMEEENFPVEYLPVSNEHKKAFEYLKESNLDWTFVCPPEIINTGPTGEFTTRADYPPISNNYKINAGDLALFMLNELEKNEYVNKRVGISNI